MKASPISFLIIDFQLATKKLPSCGFSCTSISSLFCASDGVACPPPLEVEGNSPHASVVCTVPDGTYKLPDEKVEVEDNCLDGNVEAVLKGILKKEGVDDRVEDGIGKGRVQWMDYRGRELVEVKEFEARSVFV